tara:strand:+ start:940 stop:1683 length:744 start_codon:yes stop_codon:yes gene_type:complete
MLKVQIVKALQNNYVFILTCDKTGKTAVVDPGVVIEVEQALKGKRIDMILNTHQHDDHCYGVKELIEKHHCMVYVPAKDIKDGIGAAKYVDDKNLLLGLKHKDTINVGETQLEVLEIPGHTQNHIAYYSAEEKILFSGDTVFAAGCGNTFDGNVEDLYTSIQRIKGLDKFTKIFCSHEYTENNLNFAIKEFPELEMFKVRLESAKPLLDAKIPMVPLKLSEEIYTNPFMLAPNLAVFKDLREKKDNF